MRVGTKLGMFTAGDTKRNIPSGGTSSMDPEVRRIVERRFPDYLQELVSLIRKPSVSATGEGVEACASYLVDRMNGFGIETQLFDLPEGNPLILGTVPGRDGDRTLLIYDHYDVQPPDPLEEWSSDPFSGEISQGRVLGRGANDSKGNLVAYLAALDAISEEGVPPISITFLFEGEEEIGSPHLEEFVNSHRSELKADATVCCDGELDPSGRPMISLGMKGLLYLELRCRKARADSHSSMAALIPSAAWRLIEALNSLRDEDGRIAIAGWEEGLVQPTKEEEELMTKIPFDEEEMKREFGVDEFIHDRHGLEALRGLLYEPTCNIAGLSSGYEGEGSKTVLPGLAMAKLDLRLVYDQGAQRCLRLFREHLQRKGFGDVEVVPLGTLEPSHTPVSAPVVRAAAKAALSVYGREAVIYPRHHASGPDYLFTKNLGLHSIWTGCSPAFGNAHAPNEFIGIEDFRLGVLYAAELISSFADV